MKNIIITVMLLAFFSSCGQLNGKTIKQVNEKQTLSQIDSIKHILKTAQSKKNYDLAPSYAKPKSDYNIETDILESIIMYYHNKYHSGTRLQKEENDSTIILVYYSIAGVTVVDEESDDTYETDSIPLVTIDIPLKNGITPYGSVSIIEGDLNYDKKDDLVITVFSSGCGNMGNCSEDHIFIFINENNKYKLANTFSHWETGGTCHDDEDCKECYGRFIPKKIENNLITGESSCYTYEDARCCPSLKYRTKLAFANNELKLTSNKKIEKIVD